MTDKQKSTEIDPAQAREFVSNFVPNPDLIKDMPDADVIQYHGKVRETLDKSVQEALEKSKEQATWPEQWRELYAKGPDGKPDEKKLKQLQRYAAPTAALDALFAAQQKLSSGELKSVAPYPKDGTEDEKARWRAEHGVPPAPDKYETKWPDGYVVGEEDKPLVDAFLKYAHENNLPQDVVNSQLNWWAQQDELQAQMQEDEDLQYLQQSEDVLRNEWGEEYRKNVKIINGFLDTAPKGVKDAFLSGRTADGAPVGSHPGILKWLVSMARQTNPATTVVPGAGANAMHTIEDEIKSIENVMRTDRKKYNADAKMQQRLRDLYSARDKMKAA